MAWIRGAMPAFDLFQPTTIDGALALLMRHGRDAWVLAGGLDTFDQFTDRLAKPPVVIDLGGVKELAGIRDESDALVIGAMTTLDAVATDSRVGKRFGVLARAAESVGSPQIRNQGTIGGNVSQNARCWYFRSGWPCYRSGGNICYADTPTGASHEHAIFDVDRCAAVNPSDTAAALVTLDASMVIRSAGRERVVEAGKFFVSPSVDITRMTALAPDELLTAIRIPAMWAGARFYFEKVRDRRVWDFALASVAAALKLTSKRISDARVVVNGVSGTPRRLHAVERAVTGRPPDEATATLAGELAIDGAEPLGENVYKVALTRNLVRRATRIAAM